MPQFTTFLRIQCHKKGPQPKKQRTSRKADIDTNKATDDPRIRRISDITSRLAVLKEMSNAPSCEGTALLAEAAELFTERGVLEIELNVSAENLRTVYREVYTQRNFKEISLQRKHTGEQRHEILVKYYKI